MITTFQVTLQLPYATISTEVNGPNIPLFTMFCQALNDSGNIIHAVTTFEKEGLIDKFNSTFKEQCYKIESDLSLLVQLVNVYNHRVRFLNKHYGGIKLVITPEGLSVTRPSEY